MPGPCFVSCDLLQERGLGLLFGLPFHVYFPLRPAGSALIFGQFVDRIFHLHCRYGFGFLHLVDRCKGFFLLLLVGIDHVIDGFVLYGLAEALYRAVQWLLVSEKRGLTELVEVASLVQVRLVWKLRC